MGLKPIVTEADTEADAKTTTFILLFSRMITEMKTAGFFDCGRDFMPVS